MQKKMKIYYPLRQTYMLAQEHMGFISVGSSRVWYGVKSL